MIKVRSRRGIMIWDLFGLFFALAALSTARGTGERIWLGLLLCCWAYWLWDDLYRKARRSKSPLSNN